MLVFQYYTVLIFNINIHCIKDSGTFIRNNFNNNFLKKLDCKCTLITLVSCSSAIKATQQQQLLKNGLTSEAYIEELVGTRVYREDKRGVIQNPWEQATTLPCVHGNSYDYLEVEGKKVKFLLTRTHLADGTSI